MLRKRFFSTRKGLNRLGEVRLGSVDFVCKFHLLKGLTVNPNVFLNLSRSKKKKKKKKKKKSDYSRFFFEISSIFVFWSYFRFFLEIGKYRISYADRGKRISYSKFTPQNT